MLKIVKSSNDSERLYMRIYKNIYVKILLYFIFIYNSLCTDIFYSEILLTIKGNNTQQILNNKNINLFYSHTQSKNYIFNTKPSEIYVNGNRIDNIDFYVYGLSKEINNITIRFNKTITNCNVMFGLLSNITYINFKHFDFSKVTDMTGMFYCCRNLISLDLGHFNTLSATEMGNLFYYCINLISLNLKNFNIPLLKI